jgi:AcrR family transcriptional regulator
MTKNAGERQVRSVRRDALENRQRILDTAQRLFNEHGVGEVSMNQIAQAAQIGPGTLYRHYRNKSELCWDLIKDNIEQLFEDIAGYLTRHAQDAAPQRLRGVVHLLIQFREKKLQLLAGVERDPSRKEWPSRTPSPLYQDLHDILVSLFQEMVGNCDDSHSVFKADVLLTMLRSDSYVFQRDVRGYSADQLLEQICMTFFPEGCADVEGRSADGPVSVSSVSSSEKPNDERRSVTQNY